MTNSKIPTESLSIQDPANANEEILSFAAELEARGERPWFEIRYPAPDYLTDAQQDEWRAAQEEVFDAVEIVDGEIRTLPPYSELLGEGN